MEIVLRSTAIFFFLWILTRSLGKRELAEMTAFELVLLVVLGDLIQQGVTQSDTSVTGAVLAVSTIGLWVMVFSTVSYRFKGARQALESFPVIVVRDGEVQAEALRLERVTIDEVCDEARQQGIADLRDVRLAVLESDGRFSFIKGHGGDTQGADQDRRAG
jgi:uncharacterized membrane protein YcaP (DUF421 family)